MGFFGDLKREFFTLKELLRVTREVGWIKPDSQKLTPDHLEEIVDAHLELPAFITDDRTISYAEYDAYANQVAHWALEQGLKPGDVVAVFLTNRWEYVPIWVGLSKIGVVAALLNNQITGNSLAHCLNISGANVAIIDGELTEAYASACDLIDCEMAPHVMDGAAGSGERDFDTEVAAQPSERPSREHRAGITAKEPCLKMYTSGTTGLPKAAIIAHTRTMYYLNIFASGANAGPGDRMMMVLPLYHSTGGLCGVGFGISRGGAVIVRKKFSASAFWDECVTFEATLFMYVGELCRFLLAAPETPNETRHSIRCMIGNGLRPDVWERFVDRFKMPRVMEFYGATEGNVGLVNLDSRPGAIGRIPPWLKWRFNVELVAFDLEKEVPIRDADGRCRRTEPGEVGEAVGRIDPDDTRFRFDGYQNKAENEKKILRDVFKPGDAWFRTGDLMKRDKDGYFYFIDRIGDTFRWKSENVSTNEVAEALGHYPGVQQANVYGVPVPGHNGKAGMAALVVGEGFDLDGLQSHVAEALPGYARPLFYRIQTQTDTTGTFKFRKLDLVRDGFDPANISDPLWFAEPEGSMRPLDREVHDALVSGTIRV
ncbi:long-chain-acyl-CoA synthetase [Hyphobacterium marinum]|uniref:Long-chain-acyl-CoA synthetase n=1 Tax=Hyphobacterium marinum TaxID=3116574 RepID=A0ABU7LXN4_9PROT|nr:long-chain-acyl-CoA synthetase [Hyphobacterium sp. Y6023]MEE2566298.1 long-chain-acyl-CoA synthetase [Hyphobacterium sp. Y6023]